MKDIRFRAWDKREGLQKMIYIDAFVPYGEGWRGGNPDYKFYELYYGLNAFMKVRFDEVELMQYTGLKDKNSKEIYEGDIIRINVKLNYGFAGYHDEEHIAEIYFDRGCFWWKSKDRTDCNWHFYNAKDREVIGNIYQNQELLMPYIIKAQ